MSVIGFAIFQDKWYNQQNFFKLEKKFKYLKWCKRKTYYFACINTNNTRICTPIYQVLDNRVDEKTIGNFFVHKNSVAFLLILSTISIFREKLTCRRCVEKRSERFPFKPVMDIVVLVAVPDLDSVRSVIQF